MTALSPALFAALHEIAIRKRHQVPPDKALCEQLESCGLVMWNGRLGPWRPGERWKEYVITREGEAFLARRRS